jgi:RNA polymerase sigma factor (sigma-70 family)
MDIKTVTLPRKAGYTLDELIDGLKSNEAHVKRLCWGSFYDRYKTYVYKLLYYVCRNYPSGTDIASDFTQMTFINALKGIHKFRLRHDLEPIAMDRSVKAWLGKIANRVFLKEIAKWNSIELPEDLESEIIPREADFHFQEDEYIEEARELVVKLRSAMSSLSERDQDVITRYADEGCIGTERHLSDASMTYLCERYKTTSKNIRQIKFRSLKKIQKHC